MKISELKPLEKNPFKLKGDEQLEKIANSIESFKKMMSIRKIIIDENQEIIGGNKRYFALKKLGYKQIPDEWIDKRTDLTEDEKKEFIVKDNAHFGSEWDTDLLAEWNVPDLDWGVNIPNIEEINEMKEWDQSNISDFEPKENEIKLSLFFQNEQQRKEFVDNYNIKITKNQAGQWVSRMK